MKTNCLLIRNRDRAMFEIGENGIHHSVRYVPRRWWQLRGRFVRSGYQWSTVDDSEFEVVNVKYVEAGCKIMQERGEL